jgi:hypothetical protein
MVNTYRENRQQQKILYTMIKTKKCKVKNEQTCGLLKIQTNPLEVSPLTLKENCKCWMWMKWGLTLFNREKNMLTTIKNKGVIEFFKKQLSQVYANLIERKGCYG